MIRLFQFAIREEISESCDIDLKNRVSALKANRSREAYLVHSHSPGLSSLGGRGSLQRKQFLLLAKFTIPHLLQQIKSASEFEMVTEKMLNTGRDLTLHTLQQITSVVHSTMRIQKNTFV